MFLLEIIDIIMNWKITFQQRSKLAIKQISEQQGVTLEVASKQVKWLKTNSVKQTNKK